jgi:hypothetical protein
MGKKKRQNPGISHRVSKKFGTLLRKTVDLHNFDLGFVTLDPTYRIPNDINAQELSVESEDVWIHSECSHERCANMRATLFQGYEFVLPANLRFSSRGAFVEEIYSPEDDDEDIPLAPAVKSDEDEDAVLTSEHRPASTMKEELRISWKREALRTAVNKKQKMESIEEIGESISSGEVQGLQGLQEQAREWENIEE